MERGPTQSSSHVFPREDKRRFRKEWFEKYNWLEYSLVNGKAYCFCCYLFRRVGVDDDKFGYEAFTKDGFKQQKNAYLAFPRHVGGPNGHHNRARTAFDDFHKQKESVKQQMTTHTDDALEKYQTRLETSLAMHCKVNHSVDMINRKLH